MIPAWKKLFVAALFGATLLLGEGTVALAGEDHKKSEPTLSAPPNPPPGVVDMTPGSETELTPKSYDDVKAINKLIQQAFDDDAKRDRAKPFSKLHLETVKYDDGEWHSEADNFPSDVPYEYGLVHIGFYLTWAAERGFLSDFFQEETNGAVQSVLKRDQSPILLIQIWDGKLVSDMLNEEGNAFSRAHYDTGNEIYLTDFIQWRDSAGLEMYEVAPTWEHYDSLKPILDRRLFEWRQREHEQRQ